MIDGLVLWYLTPLSTMFQLYRGGQFYWYRKTQQYEWLIMIFNYVIKINEVETIIDNWKF
jgi:hypothetical protein